jgi:hypothetical protein
MKKMTQIFSGVFCGVFSSVQSDTPADTSLKTRFTDFLQESRGVSFARLGCDALRTRPKHFDS